VNKKLGCVRLCLLVELHYRKQPFVIKKSIRSMILVVNLHFFNRRGQCRALIVAFFPDGRFVRLRLFAAVVAATEKALPTNT